MVGVKGMPISLHVDMDLIGTEVYIVEDSHYFFVDRLDKWQKKIIFDALAFR